MMAKGARSYLDDTDLPALPGRDRSKNLGDRLHQAYQKQYVDVIISEPELNMLPAVNCGKLYVWHMADLSPWQPASK